MHFLRIFRQYNLVDLRYLILQHTHNIVLYFQSDSLYIFINIPLSLFDAISLFSVILHMYTMCVCVCAFSPLVLLGLNLFPMRFPARVKILFT